MTFHGGKVAAANAGEQWVHTLPLVVHQLGGLTVRECEWPNFCSSACVDARYQSSQHKAASAAVDAECFHR